MGVFVVFRSKYLVDCSVFLNFAHYKTIVQFVNDGDLETCQYQKHVKS